MGVVEKKGAKKSVEVVTASSKQIADIAKQIAESGNFGGADSSDDDDDNEEKSEQGSDEDEDDDQEDDDQEDNESDDNAQNESDNDEDDEPKKPKSKKRAAPEQSTKLIAVSAAKKPRVDDPEDTTIFVGNLSWNTTEKTLIQFFEAAGKVNGVRLISGVDGKKKGFGYVEFADSASARKGLEFSGQELDGRVIKTDRSTPIQSKKGPDTQECESLFIGNLSVNATDKSLKELFGKHGKVKEVRIPHYPDSGNPKGYFAYITMDTIESAKAALEELHGHEFEGRKLRLDYSTPLKHEGVRHSFKHGGRGGNRGRGGARGGGGFVQRGGASGDRGGRGGAMSGGSDRGRGGSSGGGRGSRGGEYCLFMFLVFSDLSLNEKGGRGGERGVGRGSYCGRGGRGGAGGDRGGRGGLRGSRRPEGTFSTNNAAVLKSEGKKITFE
ncbi:UNVERIFIED_CONTAM: hypothetical protein HDU68_005529 [Siphonaria sp. JEL0065]|nr:hypothetical protein HDU68_005529 [Siphonaria sp. JEL0065]